MKRALEGLNKDLWHPLIQKSRDQKKAGIMNVTDLAADLLLAVKSGSGIACSLDKLAKYPAAELANDLQDVDYRKTFWINLYNAFMQHQIIDRQPDLSSALSRIRFFYAENIHVAGHSLSLNDIEHGMLRHSSIWWSYGYLKKPFVNSFEKKFRVPIDYRIHFALNCGAESCPLIAFYAPGKIDDQLEEAMQVFIEQDAKYEKETHKVYLSSIFNWYRRDFGGRDGIINLLLRYHLIPTNEKVRLHFKEYDWKVKSGNFSW